MGIREEVQKVKEIDYKLSVIKARNNSNDFREFVIKDDKTGKIITQDDIHRSWIDHINHCKKIGKHCAILAPWGHGKSIQIAIAETLDIMGKNQAARIKIINSSDEYAMDRVKSIKGYVGNDPEYKAVYPKVEKDEQQQWTDHRLYIKRKGHAIDPTVEARGILSIGVGGRADYLIFDDPVDERSISSEKVRETIRQKYQNLWVPRLVDTGFIYYICTRWHEEDLTKTIMESNSYSVLIQRISDDFEYITQEVIE